MTQLDWSHSKNGRWKISKTNINVWGEGIQKHYKEINKSQYLICNAEEVVDEKSLTSTTYCICYT
jgi:hypothetical protein